MAMMEDEDMSFGDRSGDAEQRYLEVASVLQDRLQDIRARQEIGDLASFALTEILEIAAEEFGIEREVDQGKRMKREEKSAISERRGRRSCNHSCRDHPEPMNPELWKTLPPELLQLVVAHLPVDKISRLQFLSKEWQRTITSNLQFNQAFSEVHPKTMCLITWNEKNRYWVRVLDVKCSKWHAYEIEVGHPGVDRTAKPQPMMAAKCEDGGLVCFVSKCNSDSKKKRARPSFFLTIVNPLTRRSRKLPPLFDMRDMKLVQIEADRQTKAFKVFVMASRCVWTNAGMGWKGNGVTTLVYDTLREEWLTMPCDGVFDPREGFTNFDFVNGRLFTMPVGDDMNLMRGGVFPEYLSESAHYKERLFVLRTGPDGPANEESLANQSPTLYIEEFLWKAVWVKVKTHRCDPFECPPKTEYYMNLYACNGFLTVFAEISPFLAGDRYRKQLAWLYDLSTRKWSSLELPQLPLGRRIYDPNEPSMFTVELPGGRKIKTSGDYTYDVSLMCEPQWAM